MHHKNINVVPGQLTSFDIIGVIIVLVVISMDTFSLSIHIWMIITVMIMRRAKKVQYYFKSPGKVMRMMMMFCNKCTIVWAKLMPKEPPTNFT